MVRAFSRKSASPSLSEIELTTHLPWTHLSPASITDHLELSIMIGMRATSGSVAIRLRKVRHARFRVEHALVHVDVEQVGAAAHLVERDLQGGLVVVGLDQPAEARRAGDVRALADHLEVRVRPDGQGLEPAEKRG